MNFTAGLLFTLVLYFFVMEIIYVLSVYRKCKAYFLTEKIYCLLSPNLIPSPILFLHSLFSFNLCHSFRKIYSIVSLIKKKGKKTFTNTLTINIQYNIDKYFTINQPYKGLCLIERVKNVKEQKRLLHSLEY